MQEIVFNDSNLTDNDIEQSKNTILNYNIIIAISTNLEEIINENSLYE